MSGRPLCSPRLTETDRAYLHGPYRMQANLPLALQGETIADEMNKAAESVP